jgi:hypothetical protein
MKILFAYYKHYINHEPVPSYGRSMVRELKALGHDVIEVDKTRFDDPEKYKRFDLLIDLDSGRNTDGKYDWHLFKDRVPIPSVAYLIDTHGKPDEHARVAARADHVFFAVWDKRDVFADHPSAHWLPCFTDEEYFNLGHRAETPEFNWGFFGSKGGLARAEPMILICKKHGFTYDVDQVGKQYRVQWPHTAQRMGNCEALYNCGQKHDVNQRIFESMMVGRPLVTNYDDRMGIGWLFERWQHYIPYESYTMEGLERAMTFVARKPEAAKKIAEQAYNEVKQKHLVQHRVAKVLEVVNV